MRIPPHEWPTATATEILYLAPGIALMWSRRPEKWLKKTMNLEGKKKKKKKKNTLQSSFQ